MRKRSCPAVSQICSFTVRDPTSTVRKRKSTPTVEIKASVNSSSAKRSSKQLLPTAVSPIMTSLNMNSGTFVPVAESAIARSKNDAKTFPFRRVARDGL